MTTEGVDTQLKFPVHPPNTGPGKSPTAGEWRAGWKVLAASWVGAGTGFGLYLYVAALFILPMQAEFRWSRTAISIGPMISLIQALLNPFVGIIADRVGARPVALTGIVLLCIAFLTIAASPPAPVPFYAAVAFVALASTGTTSIVYAKGIASWFIENTGSALGILMSGISIISALAFSSLQFVIARYGWRAGFQLLAATTLILGLPIVFAFFREHPALVEARRATIANITGHSVREGARESRFWIMAAFLAFSSVAIGGFLGHLQPLLVSHQFSPTAAAKFGAIFALGTGVGRITIGVLLDHLKPALVAASCMALAALGSVMLAGQGSLTWISAGIAVFLIGLGQGAELDFMAFFTLRIFGVRSFSALIAIFALLFGIGVAIGGLLFAVCFDHYGSYEIATFGNAILFACAAILVVLLRVPIHSSKPLNIG
jgi:MFS family permease